MIRTGDVLIQPAERSEAATMAIVRSPALMFAAYGLLALFTVADIFSRGIIVSILYVVPLVVLAWAGYGSKLRQVALLMVVVVYAVFFGKWLMYARPDSSLFNFALVNRTFVALTICALAMLLKLRISTEYLRSDAELPETMQCEEDETDETLAVLLAVGMTAFIALADFLSPANYNLAILYLVPLFLCAWARRRRLLWGMLAVALVLTAVGFVCGPPTTSAETTLTRMIVNRTLAAFVLTLLAVLLHFQIGQRTAGWRLFDSRRQSGTSA